MRTFQCRPGQRVAIDTACSTAQTYEVRILDIRRAVGASIVTPRLVYTPTLSPDAAWSTSGSPTPYRFDPSGPFTLTCGGSLYLEQDAYANVSGVGVYSIPNLVSEIDYEVITYGTGLNDGIHQATPLLSCTYMVPTGSQPVFRPLPPGTTRVELLGTSAAPSTRIGYEQSGVSPQYELTMGAGLPIAGAYQVRLPVGAGDNFGIVFRLRIPGAL